MNEERGGCQPPRSFCGRDVERVALPECQDTASITNDQDGPTARNDNRRSRESGLNSHDHDVQWRWTEDCPSNFHKPDDLHLGRFGHHSGERIVSVTTYTSVYRQILSQSKDGVIHLLPEPIDCLDRACRIHEGCLSGLEAFGRSGSSATSNWLRQH